MPVVRIKPIKSKYKAPQVLKAVQEARRKEARNVQREYESTTRTWKTDVNFEMREVGETTAVGTTSEIYKYVDGGTRPHIIRPKGNYPLRFNTSGFVAKTVPNRLNPRAGRAAQPPTAHALQVHHPGTKAREFTRLIRKRSQERFARNVDKAVREAVRRARG